MCYIFLFQVKTYEKSFKVIIDKNSLTNKNNRFQITIINYNDDRDTSVCVNGEDQNKKSIQMLGNLEDNLKEKIKSWYEINNYFSYISICYNADSCSCGFNPMVNYFETHSLQVNDVKLLKEISADKYTCPKCGDTITHSDNNNNKYLINKTEDIRYICNYIYVNTK